MLGDLADLGGSYLCLADGIEEAGFAVVYMPHYGNHRRARLLPRSILFPEPLIALRLLGRDRPPRCWLLLYRLIAKLRGYDCCRLVVNSLIDAGHYAISHQLLNHVHSAQPDQIGQLPHGEGARDRELTLRFDRSGLRGSRLWSLLRLFCGFLPRPFCGFPLGPFGCHLGSLILN
ncbi:hypothetical protein ES703_00440 [subsurface metagenome]